MISLDSASEKILTKYLDTNTESLDELKSNPTDTAQTSSDTIAPQPSFMEVDTQSRLDKLISKNVAVSEFERTLDGLKGDGQNLLAEFVDWEVSGPTYTFNELRNEICGDAKFKFDAAKVSLYGLFYTCRESKKEWINRTIDLEYINFSRHPKTLEELLQVDAANYDVFNFQRSLNIEAINNETKALDRKAHLFWEIPAIDAKVCNFMDSISISGDAKRKQPFTQSRNAS